MLASSQVASHFLEPRLDRQGSSVREPGEGRGREGRGEGRAGVYIYIYYTNKRILDAPIKGDVNLFS